MACHPFVKSRPNQSKIQDTKADCRGEGCKFLVDIMCLQYSNVLMGQCLRERFSVVFESYGVFQDVEETQI